MADAFVRVRCPSCASLVRVTRETGRHPCGNCGALITVKLPGDRPPPLPLSPGDAEALIERSQASREIAKAIARLKWLRWSYVGGALLSSLGLLVALAELSDPQEVVDDTYVMVALTTGALILNACAFLLLLRQPLVWSLVIASATTLLAGLMVAGSSALDDKSALIPLLGFLAPCAAVTWWIFAVAKRLHRLSVEHPELHAAERAAGMTRRRRPENVSEEEWEHRRELLVASERRRVEAAAIGASSLLLTVVGVASSIRLKYRPQEIDEAVTEFVEAWNVQDAQEIVAMALPRRREDIARRLANVSATREWERWPELVETGRSVEGSSAIVEFLEEDDTIRVEWALVELHWQLDKIVPPLPMLDRALHDFESAWRKSDVKAVAALFAPDSRERMESALLRHLKKRDWQDEFPALEYKTAIATGEERAEASFDCAAGSLVVRWKLDNGDYWVLSAVDWPDEK